MSECNNATDGKLTNKELYEKAIEGRKHHLENYNHWMNMYAIFNGALFVAVYNLFKKSGTTYAISNIVSKDPLMFTLILTVFFLGTICGWAWHKSVKGYYSWIISWINIVSYYEGKLKTKDNEEVFVYRLYGGGTKGNAYSTQKLTLMFTFFVAVSWTTLLLSVIYIQAKEFLTLINGWNDFVVIITTFILISIIAIVVEKVFDESLHKIKLTARENLKNGNNPTHACLREKKETGTEHTKLKEFCISDFD